MSQDFMHYLSYGATDQQTARRLAGYYDGLLIPGTVAAFQRTGTGGFVLTLSATRAAPKYMIDPRFPLFQQRLPSPKKSHEALAALLGAPELVRDTDPAPGDFSAALVDTIARSWVAFNSGYTDEARKSFDKYAQRLGEEIRPGDSHGPDAILSPYLIAQRREPGWWAKSRELHAAAQRHSEGSLVVQVVAAEDARLLGENLAGIENTLVGVWVSGLNEMESDVGALSEYALAIARASRRGVRTFALYGGFFSVLLGAIGLGGSSHGIGYGESRSWVELPQSGPPPARYYLPKAHRYVGQDLAYQLWVRDRSLAECNCEACAGRSPLSLGYGELMDHSVLCRAAEIADWLPGEPLAFSARLQGEYSALSRGIVSLALPTGIRNQAVRAISHLPVWVATLGRLAPELSRA